MGPSNDMPVGDSVVGDIVPEAVLEAKSLLDGIDENYVMTIHNPLTSDFRVQYARSIVSTPRQTREEQETRDKAGLPRVKEQNAMQHTIQFLTLKAGETKNLPGDIGQIAARKLVTYILMAGVGKGSAKMVADRNARRKVEEQVVEKVTSRLDFMNVPPEASAEDRTAKEIGELNTPVLVETPEIKDPSEINPPPGTGMSFERATPEKSK